MRYLQKTKEVKKIKIDELRNLAVKILVKQGASKKDAEIILNKIYSIRENPYRFLKRLQGEKLWKSLTP